MLNAEGRKVNAEKPRNVDARMKEKELALPAERVRQVFVINADDPNQYLRWNKLEHRVRRIPHGEVAGCVFPNGYRKICVNGRSYQAHRLAFAYHYGRWPIYQIDHINGVRDDNRIENLREVTHAENHKNKKLPNTNKSGVPGVRLDRGKWVSAIYVGKRQQTYLGRYSCFLDAVAARYRAEREYGFHQNHGRLSA